jgi:hypothetical protein
MIYSEEELMIPKGLLPPDLEGSAFIAGGYAACPALATDIDLWVYVAGESLADARDRILLWLQTEMWPYETQEDNRPQLADSTIDGYSIISSKVAIVRSPHLSHPIHIMVCAGSIQELLETFDISTHQIALSFGGVIKGPRWTPITERPVIIRSATGISTQKTQERLGKIATRYGHSIPRTFNEALQGVR